MGWPWRIGMLIVSGVPAIVGGGLMWHFFSNWTPVILWEILLLLLLSFAIARGDKGGGATSH
jgi:uncharacterized membrane protein YbhN (UPF0104 family)